MTEATTILTRAGFDERQGDPSKGAVKLTTGNLRRRT